MRGSAVTQAQAIVDLAGNTLWPVPWQVDAWMLARKTAEAGKTWGAVADAVRAMAHRITEAFYRGPYVPYDPTEKFKRTPEQLAHRRNWRRGKRARCQVKAQRLPRGQRPYTGGLPKNPINGYYSAGQKMAQWKEMLG